jgi:hypothetical protein
MIVSFGLAAALLSLAPMIGLDTKTLSYARCSLTTAGQSNKLRLMARTNKGVISERDALTLDVSLTNTTQNAIYVVESNPLADYLIDIRDTQGQQASPTEEGKRLLMWARWLPRRVSVLIKPGEEKRETFKLNQIYRMMAGTTYTIITKRSVALEDGKALQLISNKVKVRVIS